MVKRPVTLILSVVTIAVGLWVLRGAGTLDSACAINAQIRGATSCVSGLPFDLLGIALAAAGLATTMYQLLTFVRSARRKSTRRKSLTITTLHEDDAESLRDVA